MTVHRIIRLEFSLQVDSSRRRLHDSLRRRLQRLLTSSATATPYVVGYKRKELAESKKYCQPVPVAIDREK